MITRRRARLLALTNGGGVEVPSGTEAQVSQNTAGNGTAARHPAMTHKRSRAEEPVDAPFLPPLWRPHCAVTQLTLAVVQHWAAESALSTTFQCKWANLTTRLHVEGASASIEDGAGCLRTTPTLRDGCAIIDLPRPPASARVSSNSFKLPTSQLKAAWRGSVRDCTTLQHARPQPGLRHPGRNGGPPSGRVLLLDLSGGTQVSTAVVPTAVDSNDRRYWTKMRDAVERQRQLDATRALLTQDLHHFTYVTAHEARMRLLFGVAADQGERKTMYEREAQYLTLLDPSRSSKEENVLRVIRAIDAQMASQFSSIRHLQRPVIEGDGSGGASSSSSMSAAATADVESDTMRRRLRVIGSLTAEATRRVVSFTKLMPYQQEGVRWLLQLNFMERMNGILADDMGLGKTAQTVLYLACFRTVVEQLVEERLESLLHFARMRREARERTSLPLDLTSFLCSVSAVDGRRTWPGVPEDLLTTVQAIRILKEVKRWLWQLEEEDVCSVAQLAVINSTAPNVRTPQPHAGSRVMLPKQKRGRPSRVDTAASKAFAATGLARQEHTASAVEASLHLSDCSAAMNAALEAPRRAGPVLIVAPLSTLPHWQKEFDQFGAGGYFSLYVLNGPRADRDHRVREFTQHVNYREQHSQFCRGGNDEIAEMVADNGAPIFDAHGVQSSTTRVDCESRGGVTGKAGSQHVQWFARTPVLIIPHDLLVRPLLGPQRLIPRVNWHVVVMDEAQRIKNAQGSLFQRMCCLSCVSRLVLTGTPLQNNVVELFALLQFLAPHTFHRKQHRQLFEELDEALRDASRSNALEDQELHILLCRRVHQLLLPFILRRDKSVIAAVLPAKKEYTIVCPLLDPQRRRIREVEAKQREGRLSGNLSIQIRKILLHPYTLLPYFYVDEDVVRTSGKLLVLDFMMRFLQRTQHKFLVFCSWVMVLDVVESLCSWRNIPFVRLDGRTSVEQREVNIRQFNTGLDAATGPDGTVTATADGDDHGVAATARNPCGFLVSKAAGGVGLNLQAADTVFLLDMDYNPQRDSQALSRVYRVGQKREVRVFRLLIDHESEDGVLAIHKAKEHLDRAVVQAGKYDLHSSHRDREAALHRVFGREETTLAPIATADTPTATAGRRLTASPASPASPGSPFFPFGPGSTDDEGGASPTTSNASPDTNGSPLRVAPPGDDSPDGSPSRRRRVTFAVDAEGISSGPSLAVNTPAAKTEPPAGTYLLSLQDRLHEVLVRNPAEGVVLAAMLEEQRAVLRSEWAGSAALGHSVNDRG